MQGGRCPPVHENTLAHAALHTQPWSTGASAQRPSSRGLLGKQALELVVLDLPRLVRVCGRAMRRRQAGRTGGAVATGRLHGARLRHGVGGPICCRRSYWAASQPPQQQAVRSRVHDTRCFWGGGEGGTLTHSCEGTRQTDQHVERRWQQQSHAASRRMRPARHRSDTRVASRPPPHTLPDRAPAASSRPPCSPSMSSSMSMVSPKSSLMILTRVSFFTAHITTPDTARPASVAPL